MKKKILAKLRGKAGETIAETLIATLIAALALTMLAGAVASAANIVTRSKDAMTTYRSSLPTEVEGKWWSAAEESFGITD